MTFYHDPHPPLAVLGEYQGILIPVKGGVEGCKGVVTWGGGYTSLDPPLFNWNVDTC